MAPMRFAIGSQKSGTTWLRDCFGHVCTVPKRGEWYFTELYERITQHARLHNILPPERQKAIGERATAAAWKALLDEVEPGATFDKSAYPCWGAVRNDLHPHAVRLAREVFPDACTVVIVRDPRAVFNSALHYFSTTDSEWAGKIDPADFAATWQTQNCQWIDDAPSVLVRYEDMKSNMHAALTDVFSACRLPCDHDGVARIVAVESDVAAARERAPEPEQRPIYRVGTTDDYLKHLSPETIKEIETAAAPLMARLGYL
ncbi:MAG: hypothetical protein FD144_4755 [Rhodospirillaceae bacterium]|nr:MAG: hypothetical protein FD144_4755 [Rhodospirillaceae bacterium]